MLSKLIFAISSLLPAEGWFPVEKVEVKSALEREDSSAWVLFVKDVGGQRISLRFPEEPVCAGGEGEWLVKSGPFEASIGDEIVLKSSGDEVETNIFFSSLSIEKI